jgi:PAP2 superfamily protein
MTTPSAQYRESGQQPGGEQAIGLVQKACFVAPLAIVQTSVYWLFNHYPLFTSRQLPLTWIDRAVPFWIWTIWAYFALIAMAIFLPLGVYDRRMFQRLLHAYGISIFIAWLFFLIWPTHYVRPPLPADASWPSAAYRYLLEFDSPECCFPSSHVIVPLLACAALRKTRFLGALWYPLAACVLICTLSILTTKQHYFWDLLSGTFVAGFGWFGSGWLNERRKRERLALTQR